MIAILTAPVVSSAAVLIAIALGGRGFFLLVGTALLTGLAWVLV
ncbi:hypothetical protein [Methylobacterium sp. E-065]|nr:hypothetical protein [Methylobacterium sp. E-065]